jgi:hypothetical protein
VAGVQEEGREREGEREERWAGGRLRGTKEESGLRDLLGGSRKE